MRHLDSDTLNRLAAGEPAADEARAHLERCAACRDEAAALAAVWTRLGDADPAARLQDAPLWPAVLAAAERADARAAEPPALVPSWRFVLADAGRSPLAYAALAAVVLGIGGGHVAGRALLGSPETLSAAAVFGEATEVSSVSGLREGSLAWSYLEDDLQAIDAGWESETALPAGGAAEGSASPADSGANGGRR